MAFHEVIADDEETRFEVYSKELAEVQRARNEKTGLKQRAVHVKQHVGAVGELVVELKGGQGAGVFAQDGARFPVYARFSNAASRRQPDKLPDARALAIKLVGVPGRKFIPGLEDELTQDFLCLSEPSIPFRDPDEFMIFQRASKDGPLPLLPRFFSGFGLSRGLQVLKRLAKSKNLTSYATSDFHTVAPIAWGDTAAKLGFFPLQSGEVPSEGGADRFRHDLLKRFEAGPLAWAVRAQLFVDDTCTPIEDTSVTWSAPWIELGRLTLKQRNPARGDELDALVEKLSFDPWHAIEAHRPLGAVMRARRIAYGASVIARSASPEPKSVESF
ncbi:MAG: hypothetical protein QM756_46075 [Polyangiaceae bacterium]